MKKITQLTKKMQTIFGEIADQAGKESGMIQRERKLTGSSFVQTMVLGKLSNPDASFEGLSQTANALGIPITAQGIEQRLDERAANCLKQVLESAVTEMFETNQVEIPLLKQFNGVYLQDSSAITLPNELIDVWQGCGGSNGKSAGLKIQVELSLSSGQLRGPLLQSGKDQDRSSELQTDALPKGSLLMRDLGYWSLKEMEKRTQRGEYWLFRVRARTNITLENGKSCDLVEFLQAETEQKIDAKVRLGKAAQTPARLLAVRVPQEIADKRKRKLKEKARSKGQPLNRETLKLAEWYLLVTNVPEDMLTLREAIVLARARWQIELLFKLWKQSGKIDKWNSQKPYTILCDCYAKLLAMIVQHWFILIAVWKFPNRSLVKAAQTLQQFGLAIAVVFHTPSAFENLAYVICQCMASGCKLNSRSSAPNTYQFLLNPALLNWESLN